MSKVHTNLYDETLRYLEAKFPEAGYDVIMEAAAWVAARTLVAVNDNYMTISSYYRNPSRRASRGSGEDSERDINRRANIMRECEK